MQAATQDIFFFCTLLCTSSNIHPCAVDCYHTLSCHFLKTPFFFYAQAYSTTLKRWQWPTQLLVGYPNRSRHILCQFVNSPSCFFPYLKHFYSWLGCLRHYQQWRRPHRCCFSSHVWHLPVRFFFSLSRHKLIVPFSQRLQRCQP